MTQLRYPRPMRRALVLSAVLFACGPSAGNGNKPDGGGADPVDAAPPVDASTTPAARTAFDDSPSGAIVAPALPATIAGDFGAAGEVGAGPCLGEPPVGALYPRNWTPPLFEWSGGFEV